MVNDSTLNGSMTGLAVTLTTSWSCLYPGWAGNIGLLTDDHCPLVFVWDSEESVPAGGYFFIADHYGITEGDDGGLVGACTPYFAVGHEVAEYFTALYARA